MESLNIKDRIRSGKWLTEVKLFVWDRVALAMNKWSHLRYWDNSILSLRGRERLERLLAAGLQCLRSPLVIIRPGLSALFKYYLDQLLSMYIWKFVANDLLRGRWRKSVTSDHLEPPRYRVPICPREDLKSQIESKVSRNTTKEFGKFIYLRRQMPFSRFSRVKMY